MPVAPGFHAGGVQPKDGVRWLTTVLDAYALPMLRWAVAKLPDKLYPYPHAAAHLERMSADPGVREVIAAEKAA